LRKFSLFVPLLALLGAAWAKDASAAPTLDDYRHFRALTVDLKGRIPTRDEIAAFEKPGFDMNAWIDAQLTGPAYADRVTRIYMDLLRLQVSPVFNASNGLVDLRREKIVGPDGTPMYVFYRLGQRRTRVETDGDFCLTPDDTGLAYPVNTPPVPYPTPTSPPKSVPQDVLDAATVVVKPWWLYRDYKSASPAQYYNATTWAQYGFQPAPDLLLEPDGVTPTTQIRICREETQTAETGHVYQSKRTAPVTADGGLPFGRFTSVPYDDAYTTKNAGQPISCRTQTGISRAQDCGCGVGLERCFPTAANNVQFAPAVVAPELDVLGTDSPIDSVRQASGDWDRLWWSEEARQFLSYVFGQDRDFREILNAPYTFVNGPLIQYYQSEAPAGCCGAGVGLGYTAPDALFDPARLPKDLLPHDANKWELVSNRGAHASGILTMPIFLTKFGTRRSRAHVLYNAFLCKDFIAPPNLQLAPSTDPNLMTRPGCNSCHATLEPLAAYFSRVMESDITYLPPSAFPTDTTGPCSGANASLNPVCQCKTDKNGNLNGTCKNYYDPSFSDGKHAVLRGAYPDTTGATQGHAESGPAGIAAELVTHPEFASCVAQNVASSFLGRPLTTEDEGLQQALSAAFTGDGFKLRAVVRAMVLSDAYRHSNNLTSSAWRDGGSL